MYKRISQLIEAIDAHWSLVGRVVGWGSTAGAAAVAVWAAWANELLAAHAPLSYVISGLFGGALFALILGLFAWFRYSIVRTRYLNELGRPAGNINPLDSTFQNRRINLNAFSTPFKVVEGKTFTDCELIGPANIALFDYVFSDNHLYSCDFIELAEGKRPSNVINFDKVTIRRCKLYQVTILFRETDAQRVRSGGVQGANWLTEPAENKGDTDQHGDR